MSDAAKIFLLCGVSLGIVVYLRAVSYLWPF